MWKDVGKVQEGNEEYTQWKAESADIGDAACDSIESRYPGVSGVVQTQTPGVQESRS